MDKNYDNGLPEGTKITPMLEQWIAAKQKAKDAILLFRMGDFYEMFAADAENAAPILELALTSRDKGKEGSLKMAGFPHQAAPAYIAKLISRGFKVAICDQMEDPKSTKTIVKREISRIVTAGTVIDEDTLQPKANNYLASVVFTKSSFGLCALDLSTGDFIVTATPDKLALIDELERLDPAEVLILKDDEQSAGCCDGKKWRIEQVKRTKSDETWFASSDSSSGSIATGLIVSYIKETQGHLFKHIQAPKRYSIDDSLIVDATTRQHLNVDMLLKVIDKTKTAMGGRQLSRSVQAPSTCLEIINSRLDAVENLVNEPLVRQRLGDIFKKIHDIERLVAKTATKRISPREMAQLKDSIGEFSSINAALHLCTAKELVSEAAKIIPSEHLYGELNRALALEPPISIREGGTFRLGYDELLDEFIGLSSGGRDEIAQIEIKERQATGIPTLKVRYTRVFGYYIEVTKAQSAKVPDYFKRKQTVANAERYVTDELARLEERVQTAEQKSKEREVTLFNELQEKILNESDGLLNAAKAIAQIDCWVSFAEISQLKRYARPKMLVQDQNLIHIKAGRHPIVETMCEKSGTQYVPNDIYLNGNETQILLVTGPNMAGKSTIMRQVALIQILAQAGCFVPASDATISICDRIFTRIGASDDLIFGRSTFMVEMHETAHILKHATKHSLILLDEIGRGTSTFDGLSIAWAVTEYIHDKCGARTMFATHYHELTKLSESHTRVANFHVTVKETQDKIEFMYSLKAGAAERSYGIHVALLAGLPKIVIKRAENIMANLEQEKLASRPRRDNKMCAQKVRPQLNFFGSY